jgi:hypothetical protein
MQKSPLLCIVLTLLAATAHAKPSQMPPFLEGADLPTAPGTPFAQRRAWQDHEAAEAHRPKLGQIDATAALTGADFANLAASAWTVTHQDITVELDAKTSQVTTDANVTVHVTDAGVKLLMFYGDLDEAWTVTVGDGGALKVDVGNLDTTHSSFSVALPVAATPNSDVVLQVHRVVKLNCAPGGNQGFLQCNTAGTYHWMAGSVGVAPYVNTHVPFSCALHIKTAANEVAAATGLPKGVDVLPDGRKVWHFEQPERSEHNDAFAVAAYKMFESKSADGNPIRIFTTNNYASNASNIATLVSDVLTFYGTHMSKFPWTDLNMIQLADNFGGGESFLMGIFAYQSVFDGAPGNQGWESSNSLLSHEIAHQWWGNFVAPQGLGDVCLSESMAEFSSAWFTETALGNRSQILTNNLSFAYTVKITDDKAVNSASVYSAAKYVDIIYHKGSVVLDMLRREVGDDVMTQALALYASTYGRDFATLAQLQGAVEKASGRDLAWFFTQWFKRVGVIKAQVSGRAIHNEDGSWIVRVRVVQPTDAKIKPYRFRLPVHIEMVGHAPIDVVMDVQALADEPQIQEFPVPAPPLRVKCDWQRQLLRKFVVGTPGDVNLSGLVDGADLIDMAYRQGRGVVHQYGNGKMFFFPDTAWNELYDLSADGLVNADDANALNDLFGTAAEEF